MSTMETDWLTVMANIYTSVSCCAKFAQDPIDSEHRMLRRAYLDNSQEIRNSLKQLDINLRCTHDFALKTERQYFIFLLIILIRCDALFFS